MEIGTERIMPVFGKIRAAAGASDENPVITVQGTDGSEDRHGTPISTSGWNFEPFKRNPCALWAHGAVDGWPAVGVIQDIRSFGGAWDFDSAMLIKQWRHLDVNMPAFLWETYRDFGLGAVSVSFIPKKWEDYTSKDIPSYFAEGVRYLEQELTEISFVNVPSNRNALAKGMERYRGLGKGDVLARLLGYEIPSIVLRSEKPEERMPVQPTMPITPATTAPPAKTSSRARLAALRTTIRTIREAFRGYWIDSADSCGSAYVYVETCPICGNALTIGCDCTETLTAEQAAAEQATISEMLDISSQRLAAALTGWESAEHDALRSFCSSAVFAAMWDVDRFLQMQDFWYPESEASEVGEVSPEAMRKFITAVKGDPKALARMRRQVAARAIAAAAEDEPEANTPEESLQQLNDATKELMELWSASDKGNDDVETVMSALDDAEERIDEAVAAMKADQGADAKEKAEKKKAFLAARAQRVGAEISAKNQKRLEGVHDHARAIVDEMRDILAMDDDNLTTDKSGLISVSRAGGEGHSSTVISATDAPAAGAGGRSTPPSQPDLYRGILSVTR